MKVYLDNSATTKPYKEVIEEISKVMECNWGNPSSAHELGYKAHKKLKECREKVSGFINCEPSEIVFTSGGTEGNNLCIKGIVQPGNHIITSNIEHPSVKNTVEYLKDNGCEVTVLKVNEKGLITVEELNSAIKDNTVLVTIMHMNNELGVLQDLEAIGEYLKTNHSRIKFHVDAVQSFCKHEIDVKRMKIDMLSTSAHKHHGPRGVGFTYIRKGLNPKQLIHGSSQEKGFRAGTENVYSIAGMVKAAEIMYGSIDENYRIVTELKKYCIDRLTKKISGIRINSKICESISPYVLNVSIDGTPSEVMVRAMSDKGVYISKGSACSSKTESASHVLKAMKLTESEIKGTIRISFCEENTVEEIDYAIDKFTEAVKFLRRLKI
ncbi:cysteine desulfurase family protein [Oceanirhabdus sp. W0125-5]|uniref:cysteine desulfurase family protein n=1 Tax=Oceanirhabdus sp. W0125-5 TaxID=2999116 RepID=UPI0022F2CC85|nr:cysteine desulfurase family protein [Oceanirhabdus sp. W0125-5]WBW95497.1 cysteine desulfurase family protein [Oceanirhabdus sp. W0125-5]